MLALLKRVFLFGIGGLVSLALKLLITNLLSDIPIQYSYPLTLILVSAFNFFINYTFVFRENNSHLLNSAMRYCVAISLFLLIDYLLVLLFTRFFHEAYFISISIATILVFFIKYIVYHKGVFKRHTTD
ncbi:MAG: GtrA family protein [Puniceicoccaceae bacterium]